MKILFNFKTNIMGEIADYYRDSELEWEEDNSHLFHINRQGQKQLISNMTDLHLVNTIKYLIKSKKDYTEYHKVMISRGLTI